MSRHSRKPPQAPYFNFRAVAYKSMPKAFKSFLGLVRVSEGQRKSHAISAAISTEPLFFFPDRLYSRPGQRVKPAADQTEPPPFLTVFRHILHNIPRLAVKKAADFT